MEELQDFEKVLPLRWVKSSLVRTQSYEMASFVRDWERLLTTKQLNKLLYTDLTIPQIEFIPEALDILDLKFPNHKDISKIRNKFNLEFKDKIRESRLNEILK